MPGSRTWTTEHEAIAKLRKRWAAGEWLTNLAERTQFEPVRIPLAAPNSADLEQSFGEVLDWSARWLQSTGFRLERKRIGGRGIGSNEVPCRAWVDTFDQLCALLGKKAEVTLFQELLQQTEAVDPRLRAWPARYPIRALEMRDEWQRLLATAEWIRDCPDPGAFYLRQIDSPGVDTKFIESHRKTVSGLLDLVLPADRVDASKPVSRFADRYGFKTKPEYVRLRVLDGPAFGGFTELSVRTDEFRLPEGIETVFVVENETSYLAFPEHPSSVVLLGGGYAVAVAGRLVELSERRVVYWGDLDTHGFAILNRLRTYLPGAESMLMDEETLLGHRAHWVSEPDPTKAKLEGLAEVETELYTDIVNGRWGTAIRLEQERVRFSRLTAALQALNDSGFQRLPVRAGGSVGCRWRSLQASRPCSTTKSPFMTRRICH